MADIKYRNGAVAINAFQSVQYIFFRLEIKASNGFVEYEQLRVAGECAGNGDSLFLRGEEDPLVSCLTTVADNFGAKLNQTAISNQYRALEMIEKLGRYTFSLTIITYPKS